MPSFLRNASHRTTAAAEREERESYNISKSMGNVFGEPEVTSAEEEEQIRYKLSESERTILKNAELAPLNLSHFGGPEVAERALGEALRGRPSKAVSFLLIAVANEVSAFLSALCGFLYPELTATEGRALAGKVEAHMKLTIRGAPTSHAMLERYSMEFAPFLGAACRVGLAKRLGLQASLGKYGLFVPPHVDTDGLFSSPELLPLALYSDKWQGAWTCLYSSHKDGRSFNRVVHAILNFDGPTTTVIKTSAGEVFGFSCITPWKDSNKTYGSSENVLYTLAPDVRIMRAHPGSKATDFQWLNEKGFQLPHGFGCGSPETGFRIFINEGFDRCIAKASDLNYEAGAFLGPGTQGEFKLEELQVYGCGGEESISRGMAGQKQARATQEENLRRARKVDRAAFAGNAFDREMLLGNTFAHQQQVKDREPAECT